MTEPAIEITRVFDAPIERVWQEWTEPSRFADWFGGPAASNPLETVTMDVREGGAWNLTMHVDSRVIEWHGEYVSVAAPARLVFTITDQPPGTAYAVVTVDLRDLGDDRTEMQFSQRGGGMTHAQAKAAGAGWGSFFDHIAHRLASG